MADEFAYKRDSVLQARLGAEVEALSKQPCNSICADCGDTKRIRFTSVTLGIFLCNRCVWPSPSLASTDHLPPTGTTSTDSFAAPIFAQVMVCTAHSAHTSREENA
jgi:hypothetical protein